MPRKQTDNTVILQQTTLEQWRKAKRSPFGELPLPFGRFETERDTRPLADWLRYYFPNVFYLPFSVDHIKALETIEQAIAEGGNFALAMPRGSGKSSMVKGATLWAILTGQKSYVIALAAKLDLAIDILHFVKISLETNEKLIADYPVLAKYINHLEGKPQKAKTMLRPTEDGDFAIAGTVWERKRIILPFAESALWSEASIDIDGITSGIKGHAITRQDGTISRPDFAFLDDLSTRESAESSSATNRLERLVNGDVLALGGPDTQLSAVNTCTITCRDDLADRMLDHERNPQWQGLKAKMVYEWPCPEGRKQWDSWMALKRQDILRGTDTATSHFEAHRATMEDGVRLGWPERHRVGSTALEDIYSDIVRMGIGAFLAEYQNEPLALTLAPYSLSATDVINHANGFPRYLVPQNALNVVLMADINHTGIHYAITAWGTDGTAHICDYGKFPENEPLYNPANPKTGEEAEIYKGLQAFCSYIKAKPIGITLATIDVGNWLSTVEKYIANNAKEWPCKLFGSRGRASTVFRVPRETVRAKANSYMSKYNSGLHVITHNACRLREKLQKSFLLPLGIPGSITLYGQPMIHSKLSEHMTAERLMEIRETREGKTEYVWEGKGENDLQDAIVGTFAIADIMGIWDNLLPDGTKDRRAVAKGTAIQPQRRKGRGLVQ